MRTRRERRSTDGQRRSPRLQFAALGVAVLGAAALTASPTAFAAAARSIDRRVVLGAEGTVVVSNVAGSVVVTGWDNAEVRIGGSLGSGVERLDVRQDGNRLVIKVIVPRARLGLRDGDGRAALQLSVPKRSRLEISTVSAAVESTRVSGEQQVNSVSGDVGLDVAGAATEIKTVSGDVTVRGSGESGNVRVTSVSGTVRVTRGAGSLEATTVSGDQTLDFGIAQSLRLRSTSGDLRIRAASDRGGSLDVASVSGDVTLNVKAATGTALDIESFSGDIESCFGARGQSSGARGPGSALRVVRGAGGSRVRIKTMSGDVQVCDR